MDTPGTARLRDVYAVLGGSGFIGSNLAAALHQQGKLVRIVDKVPLPEGFDNAICSEFVQGNLCDSGFCASALHGVHTVFHFAANMGGMGTIHDGNDFIIYRENSTMTLNILEATLKAQAKRFVFASSACVYPDHLQLDNPVHLREDDVWRGPPPSPQGLYGLEKLVGELLVHQFRGKVDVRIARFHNVYGPRGAWRNGREKAPAALARKAVVSKLLGHSQAQIEMWGSGEQSRSFLFIDDCVAALLKLLDRGDEYPINVGSDQAVTMKELAAIAARSAGFEDSALQIVRGGEHSLVGVHARNSDNTRAIDILDWKPETGLEQGMLRTVQWIEQRARAVTEGLDASVRTTLLTGLQSSTVVRLEDATVIFAVLLPVTSRGAASPTTCIDNLRCFAQSLADTTWRDRQNLGGLRTSLRVYYAIDTDDSFLMDDSKGEQALWSAGIADVQRVVCHFPRGHVCSIWRLAAERAYSDGCTYILLLGDDVELLDEGWMRYVHQTFENLSRKREPMGFGCVAFTDVSFPGMPTFPVIHRLHMEIFKDVIPNTFINQDGDPYLFQLYRGFDTSTMIPLRVRNGIGGSEAPRYERQHLQGWTFDTLTTGIDIAEKWLAARGFPERGMLTLDVVVPCYRVDMGILNRILTLKPSSTCSVMFIVIVDDPTSPYIGELLSKHGHRADVRIRVNTTNLGASASRNRGLQESAAEWVHFLDDDVIPEPDLLIEDEKAIRAHPRAAGFVGNVQFPSADTVFKTAVHLSGVTYFWDIATKLEVDVPWGVTASLLARRNLPDGVTFDPRYPKTGGGEDIDFCVRKRDVFISRGMDGFFSAPKMLVTHPWWNNGRRSYGRFYRWSKGDGALASAFPQHSYINFYPTSAELGFTCACAILFGLFTSLWRVAQIGAISLIFAVLVNVLHDATRHLVRERTLDERSTLHSTTWILAVLESSLIRMWSEVGRLVGQLERGEVGAWTYGRRFDWFVSRIGHGPANHERRVSAERFWLWLFVTITIVWGTGL